MVLRYTKFCYSPPLPTGARDLRVAGGMNYVYFLQKPPARATRRPGASFVAQWIGHAPFRATRPQQMRNPLLWRHGLVTPLFGRLPLSKCGPELTYL